MDVQLHAQEFPLTPALRAHLERRLRFAFGRVRERVMRVVVRLRDLNGPRGGPDKVCQVSVTLPGQPPVVIRETGADMYRAISRAVQRAAFRAAGRPLPLRGRGRPYPEAGHV
ncbi:MAG TPA: HPF/RaiA family ribosome-associated protein [Noviherbaspirillum sp.]|uniref:HPF/RaiA family ribosome-associated protein n=1 Tax=Noviherbaspirillum sp. TaxID=1926288 RepID=UPI002D3EEABC|nr:HPF/RaiA family ribosome-associated protein [Noviherbaspirillum sp.]HYD94902.1 HPF/RaiA family ribosome-associated protein [Noviherbaspirillum sp.]